MISARYLRYEETYSVRSDATEDKRMKSNCPIKQFFPTLYISTQKNKPCSVIVKKEEGENDVNISNPNWQALHDLSGSPERSKFDDNDIGGNFGGLIKIEYPNTKINIERDRYLLQFSTFFNVSRANLSDKLEFSSSSRLHLKFAKKYNCIICIWLSLSVV